MGFLLISAVFFVWNWIRSWKNIHHQGLTPLFCDCKDTTFSDMSMIFFLTFDKREYETCFFDKIIQKNLLSIQKDVVTLQKVSGIGHVGQCW